MTMQNLLDLTQTYAKFELKYHLTHSRMYQVNGRLKVQHDLMLDMFSLVWQWVSPLLHVDNIATISSL